MSFAITPEFVQSLLDQIELLTKQNAELYEQIAALTRLVEELRQIIKEQEEKLHKNPRNSSKPPSSEGYKKPKSNREPSGKKPGAQEGHKGHGLKKIEADRVEDVPHRPEKCNGCPYEGQCECVCKSAVRHEYDIEINIVDKQHYTESYACRMAGGETISGTFPEGINSSQQYGDGIRAFAATLNTEGMMGIDRIHEFLSAAMNIPVSTGFICGCVKKLAEKLEPVVSGVFNALLGSPVVNCDETGFRTDGQLYWIHSVCNGLFTYLSLTNGRSEEDIRSIGFLTAYHGIPVHDCYSAYWKFDHLTHALCNEHILRELKGHMESHPDQGWIPDFRKLLQEMDHYKNETLEGGAEVLDPVTVAGYLERYDTLLEEATRANPIPERKPGQRGRVAKGKLRSLVDRLTGHKDEFCLFIKNMDVPFTNNLAEKSIRMSKVKIKVSGCMRTENGAKYFVKIMSYIETVKKHGLNIFNAIRTAFKGGSYGLIFPVTE